MNLSSRFYDTTYTKTTILSQEVQSFRTAKVPSKQQTFLNHERT